jgi:hypothetical protein
VCTTRPSNSIYTSAGSPYNIDACTWSCVAGYYRADGACKLCSTMACPNGQYRGACTATADRPCLACTKKPANALFSSPGSPFDADSCEWKCDAGYYRSSGSCSACSSGGCSAGQYRTGCAQGSVVDSPCADCTNAPANAVYNSAGTVCLLALPVTVLVFVMEIHCPGAQDMASFH